MPVSEVAASRHEALKGLRGWLAGRHRESSEAAFATAERLIPTSLPQLDEALGGGFPRGIIATLEGPPSSGRSTVAARLLGVATARGLGALVQTEQSGALYPPALAAAGVALDRLLIVPVKNAIGVARAADIDLRTEAFGVVVIPDVRLRATAWTRLASLTHRANALLVVLATEPALELRYFSSLRVHVQLMRIRWGGAHGLFTTLAGYDLRADIIKSKRGAPGKHALVPCTAFERSGAPLAALRERAVVREIGEIVRQTPASVRLRA